jgi:quinol monooxygenase YgiN
MKNLVPAILLIVFLSSFTRVSGNSPSDCTCGCSKDSMMVVMRFERKVKPEHVAFFKQSFDECRAKVLEQEPACLDYSLFQSYNDSTLFCLTEAFKTKGDHDAHMLLDHTKKHIDETRGIGDPSFKSTTNYLYWICPAANSK